MLVQSTGDLRKFSCRPRRVDQRALHAQCRSRDEKEDTPNLDLKAPFPLRDELNGDNRLGPFSPNFN